MLITPCWPRVEGGGDCQEWGLGLGRDLGPFSRHTNPSAWTAVCCKLEMQTCSAIPIVPGSSVSRGRLWVALSSWGVSQENIRGYHSYPLQMSGPAVVNVKWEGSDNCGEFCIATWQVGRVSSRWWAIWLVGYWVSCLPPIFLEFHH